MNQAVLLLGFGGPESREEVAPFVASVLSGKPVGPGRAEEVARQYDQLGGRSPYKANVRALAEAIQRDLEGRGRAMPVAVGYRHGQPTIAQALSRLRAEGVEDVCGIVLSPYASAPSWGDYLKAAAEALHGLGRGIRLRFVRPWFEDPLLVAAMADRVRESRAAFRQTDSARWVFTAHSIPLPMDLASGYSRQLQAVAAAVAALFGQKDWEVAYQSRSGRPQDPWLEPDIGEVLVRLARNDVEDALVIPIGFIMDHMEVLYDLDIKARGIAEASGVRYQRAATVGLHPNVVELLAERALRGLPEPRARRPSAPAPYRRSGPARIVVVGAGASGLSAAHRVAREGRGDLSLTVLEAGSRAGGVIETGRRDGFLWEGGPDSFLTEKPAVLTSAERLGLSDRVVGTRPGYRKSYVGWRGRLHPTPEGFYLLAPSRLGPLARTPLLSWHGKIRAGLEIAVPPVREVRDESLASFVRRRFGREILDRLAQPMVAGIYSADPEKLSLKATFPRFLEMERSYGSVTRALLSQATRAAVGARRASGPRYGLFATFRDGMGSWVEALASRLPPGALRLGTRVTGLAWRDGTWRLALQGAGEMEADGVILAVPGPVAAALLMPVIPKVRSALSEMRFGSVATLNVAIDLSGVGAALDGFGFVVPAQEGNLVTGCTYSSVKFAGRAPENKALFRAFVGGEGFRRDDRELADAVLGELGRWLRLSGTPDWIEIRRYPDALPEYAVGHVERNAELMALVEAAEGLALAGNAYAGIGLPDCVAGGERAAESVLARLFPGRAPKGSEEPPSPPDGPGQGLPRRAGGDGFSSARARDSA